MVKFLTQSFLKFLIINSLLIGCAGIPAGKVRLENYPEIKKDEIKSLNLGYKKADFEPRMKGESFNNNISKNLQLVDVQDAKNSNNCVVIFSSNNDYGKSKICQVGGIVAGLTLFIIPAYCYWNYEARATLLSHPQDSEIQGIIKNSISQAKIGEIFLDENNRPAKLLKTYELKDKVHEVWSLLWMLSWLVVEPNKYAPNAEYPKDAYKIMEDKISEALVRQILNDAKTFPECAKK
jgi:hypothetical protein